MNPKKDNFFSQVIAIGGGDRDAAEEMYDGFSAYVEKTVGGTPAATSGSETGSPPDSAADKG